MSQRGIFLYCPCNIFNISQHANHKKTAERERYYLGHFAERDRTQVKMICLWLLSPVCQNLNPLFFSLYHTYLGLSILSIYYHISLDLWGPPPLLPPHPQFSIWPGGWELLFCNCLMMVSAASSEKRLQRGPTHTHRHIHRHTCSALPTYTSSTWE